MEMDDNIGYHINAGFDFFLTEKFALNLDLRYRWMETDLILTSPGYSGDTNFDVHSFVIGMGIKYLF
jgi:outer membrane protein W